MKKSTKSLWLYSAILCIIAIVLVSTATLLQARLISSDDGSIQVLGTFTKNANQNIANLTEENVKLTNELHALQNSYNTLKTDFDIVSESEAKYARQTEIMRQMYIAFRYEKYDELDKIFEMIDEQQLITKEEADKYIPELYGRAKAVLEEVYE